MCVYVCVGPLTVSPHIQAEWGVKLADVIADANVQAVEAGRGEGVAQAEGVFVQHAQGAAPTHVLHTAGKETPAHPHGRTVTTDLHWVTVFLQ